MTKLFKSKVRKNPSQLKIERDLAILTFLTICLLNVYFSVFAFRASAT
jgi:hypothetical protein